MVHWLNIYAPETAKTIRAPAPEHLIRSFEQAAPDGWPGELSTFYRHFDGAEPSTAAYIFPGYRPLSLAESEKTRHMMLGIWAQVGAQMNAEFEREERSPLCTAALASTSRRKPTGAPRSGPLLRCSWTTHC